MARGETNEGRGPLYRLYINRLRRRLDPASVPRHLAMMIDGNRRWARQLGYDSAAHGHRAGAAKMKEFLRWCDDVGIRVVSLYLLSNDNLRKRDSRELSDLIEIIAELADELSHERDWRVKHVGRADALPLIQFALKLIQGLEVRITVFRKLVPVLRAIFVYPRLLFFQLLT